MNCDEASEHFPELLYGELDESSRRIVTEHIDRCDRCRREWNGLRKAVAMLDSWTIPVVGQRVEPRHAAASRNQATGLRQNPLKRFRSFFTGAAAALFFLVGVATLIGNVDVSSGGVSIMIGKSPAADGPEGAANSEDQFLLLLWSSGSAAVDHGVDSRVAEYSQWAKSLRESGVRISGEKLASDMVVLEPQSAHTPPEVATGPRIGGFFMFHASSMEKALEIAGSCPHLKHGERIEVRRIAR